MTPLTMYFCKDILELTGTPEEIFSDSYNYLIWILAGTFFSMLYNAASAILRAIGDSRTPLFALIFSSVLNIILDLLFVIVFHMGTTGVAVATVTSQGISGVLCLFYMFRHYEVLRIRKEEFQVSLGKNGCSLKTGYSHGAAVFHHGCGRRHFAECGKRSGFRFRGGHDCGKQDFLHFLSSL